MNNSERETTSSQITDICVRLALDEQKKAMFFIFLRVFLFRLPHLYDIHQFISSGLFFYLIYTRR